MDKCNRCNTGIMNASLEGEMVCMSCGFVTYPQKVSHKPRVPSLYSKSYMNGTDEFKLEVAEYTILNKSYVKTAQKYLVDRDSIIRYVNEYKKVLNEPKLTI